MKFATVIILNIILIVTNSCNNGVENDLDIPILDNESETEVEVNYSDSIVSTVIFDFNSNGESDKITVYGDKHIPMGMGLKFPRRMTLEMDGKLIWKRDSIVLCTQCGGANGDPFAQILVENDTLKMYHYGGSGWRWGIDQYFIYEKRSDKFKLVLERKYNFHAGNPEETYEEELTPPLNMESIYLIDVNNYH